MLYEVITMISEHIVNLFLVAGYYFLLSKNFRRGIFLSGLFFGMALMVKQTSLLLTIPAFVYLLYHAWKSKEKIVFNRRIWLRNNFV